MRKPDCDPDNLRMSDVLCDFCGGEWSESRPMVEGHQGSCICGSCLTVAYVQTADPNAQRDPSVGTCKLCLEERTETMWQSPVQTGVQGCRRCIRQSAAVLQKDPDSGWRRPEI
ncbi:MAG: hypothetical protein JNK53_08345 [Phycisphaerae bacterium]|nr:hypothetical protein [Phycisphaerae bacterium]